MCRSTTGIRRATLRNARVSIAWICFFFTLLATVALADGSPQGVGYVLEIDGVWNLQGVIKPLALGQHLPAAALLENRSPQDRDHIVVANLHGEVIKSILCQSGVCRECRESGGGCYDPVHPLPDAPPSPSILDAAWTAALELFSGKPDRFSVHRVRDAAFALPRDPIVSLSGSSLDLTALLDGQEGGTYEAGLSELAPQAQTNPGWKSESVSLNWQPGTSASATFQGIHPGLFLVRAKHNGETSQAWILVTTPDIFTSAESQYEKFQRQTATWGDRVSPETKRACQRAFLASLASSNSRTSM